MDFFFDCNKKFQGFYLSKNYNRPESAAPKNRPLSARCPRSASRRADGTEGRFRA